MKIRYESSRLIFLYLTTFFIHTFSVDPEAGCVLDLTAYPYQPTGDCIRGAQETINTWGGFPTTFCCRNALTDLSKALAHHAIVDDGNMIFIPQDQWRNCSISFMQRQSDSAESCVQNDHLFYGSSKCSGMSLSAIQQEPTYQLALQKCDQFNSSSFNDACKNCIAALIDLRDHLLDNFNAKKNETERAVCVVAVIVSVAAGKLGDHLDLLPDFYRCLPALDVFGEPGYIKLQSSLAKALLAVLLATIGLTMVIVLIKYVTNTKHHKNDKNEPKPVQTKEITTTTTTTAAWSGLYRFSKAEIENAMNNNNNHNNNIRNERKCLGRGSAGQVFKGVLPSGQVVAIKHIYKSNTSDSFTSEVEGLSSVRHPNLVCLFGCCMEDGEQYLVYEYCSEGNLAQHLLRKNTLLTWERRVKILRDCALALRYLHHHLDGCIVHRDVKLTNILLTEKLEPKLSDFGLAKMLKMEESKVFTEVRGTIGYMDPEYMSNAKLTCASDVYSFGIVTLQLLSGQKVIELDLDARDQLTRKAKDVSVGKRPLMDFEDPRLKGNVNSVDFESILQIAVLCVAKSSKGRPSIDVVFDEMEKAWKNTLAVAEMRARREMSSSAAPGSTSTELLPV